MIEIPPIDELREIRRRLSEEQESDPARYAAMLQQASRDLPGPYVNRLFFTGIADHAHPPADSAP